MEPSDPGPERAMRQYLAHLLESGGGCTRSVGCLDRFLVKGMNNFPPPPPPQPPSSSSLSLEGKASRCSLFEQLLNGGRRRQERLLVPDLATNWFRKQKVYLDKLSPEELACLSKDLAHEDEECSCLEKHKSQEWRRLPSKQRSKHCRPICRCSEAALGAQGTKDSSEEPVARPVSECLPITEPKSRNPFLLNAEAIEERRSKSLLRPRKPLGESNSYTPQRRSCSCLKPQRTRASCSCCSDSTAARRTEAMLPRLRCKFDLRQAPQRRLDPAHFRRISPEFFRILATYEAAMSEICPLYGISMHHWGETAECCPCEEPPPGAWQEQHFLGDDSVATARVSPCRLSGLERWKEKQEREQKEREREKKEREKEREKKEKGQKEKGQKEKEQKYEDSEDEKSTEKRRVRTSSSSEPALRQNKPGKRTCNNDTCPSRRNHYQEHQQTRSIASSSYSCARCAGEEEERQSQRRSKREESKQSFQSSATSERSRRQQEQERQQKQRNSNRQEEQQRSRNSKEEEEQQQRQSKKEQPQERQQETKPPPPKPPKKRRTLRDCLRGTPTQQHKTACFPCSPGSCPPPPPTAPPPLGGMYPGCRPLHCPNQPKGILNGITGLCKRHLLYNLGANTHPNREKYAQMQQDKQRLKRLRGREKPQREREREHQPLPEMGQTPYIFPSEPAPCSWQKHLDLPEMEMQPEDSSTTLKPYITCREERQQQELSEPWTSETSESLIFRTPDSERTLAGATKPPEESPRTQCGCPRTQSEPSRSINCRCGQPQDTFQLPPIYRSGTGTATHSQEAPSIQGGQEVAFESKKPVREKREAITRKASTETDYTRCGYRPRACYLANDYHQLMRRVARRRPSWERQKRRKPQKPPSRSASKTRQKEKPKEAPKKASVAPSKPKPKPKSKPKLKPKPKAPSPVCVPAQTSVRSLNPQVRWRHIVTRKKENRARKAKSLPEVPESQSSTRSLTICQAQSDIPSARSQSQPESCQRLPQSNSLAFVSCHCADEELIPSRSPSQKPSCLCQSLPAKEVERVPSCQSVKQPEKQEPCPQEVPPPQEQQNPVVRRSRSPTPKCKREHKQSRFPTPRRSPVPKKKPSLKRPPSCGYCSSGRRRRERSSSQSEASNGRCPRKETPKRRPQPAQNYGSLCYRQGQESFSTAETSIASSSWSQPQQSQRRGSPCRYGKQSFQPNASYPSCWHHQPLSSNASSLQDAYISQESSRAPLRSAMRRRSPIQWLPPEMSEADSPSQGSSLYSQLETGRRYYTDTQVGQATRAQCSCRSLHSSCSIRALSSNTDSVRCPCAPAPSVASVEPEPPRGAVEEQQQQYYHYPEPEPEPSYLQESPPPAPACACSQSCHCKRLKLFRHKPAFFKDSLPWEEQEHRHARTTLTTQRPPPRPRRRDNSLGYDQPRRTERLPVYHNACYYPDVNYKPWRQDQHCQATMQATSQDESQRYPPPYAVPLCQQGQYFGQGRDQVGGAGAGAGAIAAAAQGLRGLVKALGGARNRGRRPDTDSFNQEQDYTREMEDFAQDSGYQGEQAMEPGLMAVEGSPMETAFPSRTTNSFMSSDFQSYSTSAESNYQYQSLPSTSCYGSAESDRFYARLTAGRGRDRGGKPAREGRRGTTASGALVSFASGLDFSKKREGKASEVSLVKEEEEEPEPTPLAIFLDNLRAKHAASQILQQEAREKEPEVIALQDTSSSEDLADADESLETKELSLHRASEEETLVFPATYTGLLEEQIIDEYLPRPRYKRRK